MNSQGKQLIDELLRMHPRNSNCANLYEEIIAKLEDVIKQLSNELDMLRNSFDFSQTDRHNLIAENSQLRKKIERLESNQTIQFNRFHLQSQDSQNLGPIFERVDVSQSQLLIEPGSAQNQKTQLDLIQYISGQKRSCFGSSSSGHVKTPLLHQPIFKDRVYRCAFTVNGLIRAFECSLFCHAKYLDKFADIIERQYRLGEVEDKFIFRKFPDNQFIGDMLIYMLKQTNERKKDCLLVDHLNKFQLYDDILLEFFKGQLRVFMLIPQSLQEGTVKKVFLSLANIFELELEVTPGAYQFYEQSRKQFASNQDDSVENCVYEEISLNPQHPKDSISCIQKEIREPLFTITCNPQQGFFSFVIREEKPVEDMLVEEEFNISKSIESQEQLRAFQDESIREIRQEVQHRFNNPFPDVTSILSSSPQSEPRQDISRNIFNDAKNKYFAFHRGSTQSMLLSEYNSKRVSQELKRNLELKKSKQNVNVYNTGGREQKGAPFVNYAGLRTYGGGHFSGLLEMGQFVFE